MDLTIDDLPDELLIDVFRFLSPFELISNVSQVNRLWYQLAHNPVLGRSLGLKFGIPVEICTKLLIDRPLLRVLRCSALKCLPLVVQYIYKFNELQCLNIGFCELDDLQATALAQGAPQTLIHLNMEGCNFVDLLFIQNLVTRCCHLEALNLSHCLNMTDEGLLAVSHGLPLLHTLNIDGIQWLTDLALDAIKSSPASKHNIIRHLWLDGFELTTDGLARMLSSFSSALQTLSVSFSDNLSDSILNDISKLSGLLRLSLRKGRIFTSNGFINAFSSSSLTNIRHLDLSDCPAIDDQVINAICNCCGPQLITLLLNWCWSVSDTGLEKIITTCFHIIYLSLVGNHVVLGESLDRIPHSQPQMRILNLTQCNQVSDTVIARVAEQMPNLYIFDYFGERVGGSGGPEDICQYDLQRVISKVPICQH